MVSTLVLALLNGWMVAVSADGDDCSRQSCEEAGGCLSYHSMCASLTACAWDDSNTRCKTEAALNDATCCVQSNAEKRHQNLPSIAMAAEQWHLIHPSYAGGDGALLWQIFYGDFKNDDRFDEFRASQSRDSSEIRAMIENDDELGPYRADALKINSSVMVIAAAVLVVVLFAIMCMWCTRRRSRLYVGSTSDVPNESTALLSNTAPAETDIDTNTDTNAPAIDTAPHFDIIVDVSPNSIGRPSQNKLIAPNYVSLYAPIKFTPHITLDF